jgi:hypothetical protein
LYKAAHLHEPSKRHRLIVVKYCDVHEQALLEQGTPAKWKVGRRFSSHRDSPRTGH